MLAMIPWYLALFFLGWLAFPVAYRCLAFLPDRGVGLSKPLGLLLVSFAFWLPASLHLINNDIGGVLLGVLLLALLSWFAGRGRWGEIRMWLRENRRLWLTGEVLFLAAFVLWAAMRAASPDATGTEKPMELAFINAILRSPQLPPRDPWLAGYAISYYHFGYIMVAVLARLTATLGSVAFNLGVASWFALAASASYSVFYNLISIARPVRRGSAFTALLAPLFVLAAGNFGGLLEVMHGAGMFWQPAQPRSFRPGEFPPTPECLRGESVAVDSSFWRWMDIQELYCPPAVPYRLAPNRPGWWWWRSSRVLTDYDLKNNTREVIDEFPAFSFLLGDLHPHVLSIPFVLLAVGLALNLYLHVRNRHVEEGSPGLQGWGWEEWLRMPEFWLAVVTLGGLAFLNLWDFPIYLGLYLAAYGLGLSILSGRWRWAVAVDVIRLGLLLGATAVLAYLPFYIGFASQAGGLVPSLSFFTRGIHFWVMFGTLLIPLLAWLLGAWRIDDRRRFFWRGIAFSAVLVFGFWLISYAIGAISFALPQRAADLQNLQGGVEPSFILLGSLARRLAFPGMWISLLLLLAVVFARLLEQVRPETPPPENASGDEPRRGRSPVESGFLLLLILLACGLVLFPEFFYLRDQFGWRMNTIFKFYYQAWILFALAAAYAFAWLFERGKNARFPAALLSLLVLASSLIYIAFGVQERLFAQNGLQRTWSLDGANYIRLYQPDLYGALEWLRSAPDGVVAEAVGGSYQSEYARVATHTGLPNVLGWPGHEGQWRGGYSEIGSREPDLQLLYVTRDWDQARAVLLRYNVRYVVLGPAEYNRYGQQVDDAKFKRHLSLVYDSPQVRIFEVPSGLQ